MKQELRVRFAPSPTGPLHIGGVRTALYNYLLAKKYNGRFILRIEDTDQNRYVEGAEQYIMESLQWCGLIPDEGPDIGGEYGPYRQSERKVLYFNYAQKMIDSGHAYYAFDTPEELEEMRKQLSASGIHSPKYDLNIRAEMRNSLSLPSDEVEKLIKTGAPYTIRIRVPENKTVKFEDQIRGPVEFKSVELDDKVLIKADGMPTYHLANIVDDYLMKISHVIRGEEWLSSTAHHVLLYEALGWKQEMPKFAHLPLILKPTGKGKLSKRDGAKFGFPVFPLEWKNPSGDEIYQGFREEGFLSSAVINFLAFLGWNPGTEQEIFSLTELIESFHVDQIGKSGSRFDMDKAKWYNQQYIIHTDNKVLATMLQPIFKKQGLTPSQDYLESFCHLMKERVETLQDFVTQGIYFFKKPENIDQKTIRKRYKTENKVHFKEIATILSGIENFQPAEIESAVKAYMNSENLGFGQIFPILRIAMSGTTKGPGLFEIMSLLGKSEVLDRLTNALPEFDKIIENKSN